VHKLRRALALLLVLALSPTASAQEAAGPVDDVTVVRTDEEAAALDGVDLAVQLSRQTNPTTDEGVDRVLLGSAASFADALASAAVQTTGPLLLVPPALVDRVGDLPDGLPPAVHAELLRLRPQEVVLLGGTAAIGADVEAELQRLGFLVTRLAGASRVDTAVEVARSATPDAGVALLVRAFDAAGGDGSAAWADSVTAGALAAATGAPILLTETGRLSDATREHLRASGIRSVVIVGGEHAVSRDVERELLGLGHAVERIAGADRFATAVAIARASGSADGGRVVLFDATRRTADGGEVGWQAGLAAAQHALATGAVVLPTDGDTIPAAVAAHLAEVRPTTSTCLVSRTACEAARRLAGRGTRPLVGYNPPPGSAIAHGEVVVVGVDDPERTLSGEVEVTSDCRVSPVEYLPEGSAAFALATDNDEEAGGDQPPPSGGVPVQPVPGGGEGTGPADGPAPTTTPEPVEPNEPEPVEPPLTTCTVQTTYARRDGTTMTDVATFEVVDLRPRIRATSFRQVQGQPVTFADRSDGFVDHWAWHFGDGSTSLERDPTHTFGDAGCTDVSLTVSSPLRHWLTGRQFQDTEVRTLAVDPADPGRTLVEVLLVRDGARLHGERIDALDAVGQVIASATTGADGRARFAGLREGVVTFRATDRSTREVAQTVVAGHTLCPVLRIGELGSLLVVVEGVDGEPAAGAEVLVAADDLQVAGGLTDGDGKLLVEDIEVGTYDVTVRLGEDEETVSASVSADETTEVPVSFFVPPTPTPAPPPTAAPTTAPTASPTAAPG
jgi:putative cell wall-binding protein